MSRLEAEFARQMLEGVKLDKPIFERGRVETHLAQVAGASSSATGAEQGADPAGAGTVDALAQVEGEEEEFEALLQDIRENVNIQDRVLNRVPFFRCFCGADLVTCLSERFRFAGRQDAAVVAQRWMDAGVLYHVTRSELFRDSPDFLYRFKEDEVGAVLNMKAVYQGPKRPAALVDADFRSLLQRVVDRFTSEDRMLVDYESLAVSDEFRELAAVVAELQKISITELSYREKIAFFINVFNGLVLNGFVVLGPPTSLYQRIHFYNHTSYAVGALIYSLADIEHGILRCVRRGLSPRLMTPA